MFSTIHPKNHALPILAEHFADRFPQENFMIYDETRQLAAVHRAGKNFMLVDASDLNQDIIHNFSEEEQQFRDLWMTFFDSIAIKAIYFYNKTPRAVYGHAMPVSPVSH